MAAAPSILSTDPIDFLQDPVTGDIVVVGGKLQTVAGVAAAAQGIKRRMKRCAGEWFQDLDAGVRWLERDGVTAAQAILGQPFDAAKADAELRAAALDAPAVTSVSSLVIGFDAATREMTVSFAAVCTFADVPADSLATGSLTIVLGS